MAQYQQQQDLSAFGEVEVAQIVPTIQLQFPYNINAAVINSRPAGSGTVTQNDNMCKLSSGAATNSSAEIESVKHSVYHPGQGGIFRGTAVFTAGVAGNEQVMGAGNDEDGFFFGYNGAVFGLLKRHGGAPEIRTLTITTKNDTAEDITITLDGDAETDVTVTNGADKTVTANDIAAHDFADVGRGWDANAVGDTVVFISWNSTAKTGTYTLSGASQAVGSFAQTVAGVLPTDTWTAQADWNLDTFDGTSKSDAGVTLDPTKGNVYEIQYQWLGFGDIVFSIEHPTTGRFVNVHRIQYANANTAPSVHNPSFKAHAGSINTTNSTDIVLNIGSIMLGNEGKVTPFGIFNGVSNTKTLTGVSTETPVLTVRNNDVFQSKENRIPMKVMIVAASVEHTKPCIVHFYANATLVAASFSDFNANVSPLQVDKAATSFTGGTLLFSLALGKTGQQILFLSRDEQGPLEPGQSFTATVAPSSGNGAEADISFNIFVNL